MEKWEHDPTQPWWKHYKWVTWQRRPPPPPPPPPPTTSVKVYVIRVPEEVIILNVLIDHQVICPVSTTKPHMGRVENSMEGIASDIPVDVAVAAPNVECQWRPEPVAPHIKSQWGGGRLHPIINLSGGRSQQCLILSPNAPHFPISIHGRWQLPPKKM